MNYYELLNLDKKCTTKEIKKQYYKLAKLYHPDKSKNIDDRFVKISEAYNILSVPIKRYKYDLELEFSCLLNKDINLNLCDNEIKILINFYSKIRYSTEFRFLKLLFNSLPQNKKKKYNLVKRDDYKYIDITNVNHNYVMNLKLSFNDTYLNICKKIIIIANDNVYNLFVTHTNTSYIFRNSNNIFTVNILTKISDKYIIENHDIYLYNNISFYDFLLNDNLTISLPNNNINIKLYNLDPIIIPDLGLKNPKTNMRGKLIISNKTNLLEKKDKLKNISDDDKKILYRLFE